MLLIVMKYYLIFLSVLFSFLLVSNSVDGDSLSQEGSGVEVEYSEIGYVLPATSDFPTGEMMFEDVHSIAWQLRGCGRSYRTSILHHTILNKEPLSKQAKLRMDALFQSSHVYTTFISQSWEVPSEHYVFELRHILI